MRGGTLRKRFELKSTALRWQCDPKYLKFKHTDEIRICEGIIGQPRAIEALKLGLDVKYPGYNIFITGPVGTGRTTAVTKLLENLEAKHGGLHDLLYVNNFRNQDMPRLIELPAGQGKAFQNAVDSLIRDLKVAIPQIFNSEEYQKNRQQILGRYEGQHKKMLGEFEKRVEAEGFKVVQIQMGPFVRPAILPVIEGKPTSMEDAEALVKEGKLDEQQYRKMVDEIQQLERDMNAIVGKTKELQEAANRDLNSLNESIVRPMIENALAVMKRQFKDAKVAEYLGEVLTALLGSLERFLQKNAKEDEFREFKVNLMIDNEGQEKAPIIFETSPSFRNLFGTIERYSPAPGVTVSDFLNIKPGSLLRANGGYLVVNALDALVEPWVWQTIKRALRNGVIDMQAFDPYYFFSTSALKPEPITIDVKIVMIGNEWLYYLLYAEDEDFKKIFKVKANFDTVMDRSIANVNQYASFIKSVCTTEKLLPFNKQAIADIVEYGVRIAGRQDKLSTRFNVIADVIREADYCARQNRRDSVTGTDVELALQAWRRRVNLYEDKIQEMFDRDVIMVKTKGKAVGQVNGLSVYQLGNYAFGRPTKITAKTSVGRAGVINIEREANLAGRTYNKGVLILSGFLRSRYAQDHPLAMDATLAFEQSYSEVDGDSASSAEIYAILSALSDVAIDQAIAVTGSVNQHGEIQPIGGVNEKIEGFYEVCKTRGLTGAQGVLIPRRNAADLMLKQEVVDAVKKGRFHVYAIDTVDEGIQILTGRKAGRRRRRGFERGTINDLVMRRLLDYAEKMKGPGQEDKKEQGGRNKQPPQRRKNKR